MKALGIYVFVITCLIAGLYSLGNKGYIGCAAAAVCIMAGVTLMFKELSKNRRHTRRYAV